MPAPSAGGSRGRATPVSTPGPERAIGEQTPGPGRAHDRPPRPRRAANALCLAATAGVLVLAALAVRESATLGRAGAGEPGEASRQSVEAPRPKVEPITLERVRDAGLS